MDETWVTFKGWLVWSRLVADRNKNHDQLLRLQVVEELIKKFEDELRKN